MSKHTILSQIAKIRDFEKGHRATQVINTGFRFGILNALAESPEGLTVPELAIKLMLYAPFLKIWCQTAYHFEILDCDEKGRFKLQPFLDEVLGSGYVLSGSSGTNGERRPVPCPPKETDDPFQEYIRTGRFAGPTRSPLASFATCRATRSISTIFLSMIFPEQRASEKTTGGRVCLSGYRLRKRSVDSGFCPTFSRKASLSELIRIFTVLRRPSKRLRNSGWMIG